MNNLQDEDLEKEFLKLIRIGSSNIASFTGLYDKDENQNDIEKIKSGPRNFMLEVINDIVDWRDGTAKVRSENEHTLRGKKFENPILDFYEKISGYKLFKRQEKYVGEGELYSDLLTAIVDGLVQTKKFFFPVEVKCPKKLYDSIPQNHYTQVQFQIFLMEKFYKKEIPFGHYLAMTVDPKTEKLNTIDFLFLKVKRDDLYINEMCKRMKYGIKNLLFVLKIPETNEVFPIYKGKFLVKKIKPKKMIE